MSNYVETSLKSDHRGNIQAEILKTIPDGNMRWYIENQRRLVWLYEGMFIVIVNKQVVGTFMDRHTAEKWAWDKFYDAGATCIRCERGTRQYYIDLT